MMSCGIDESGGSVCMFAAVDSQLFEEAGTTSCWFLTVSLVLEHQFCF